MRTGLVVSVAPLLVSVPTADGSPSEVSAARNPLYAPAVGDVVVWDTANGVPVVSHAVVDFPTDDGTA